MSAPHWPPPPNSPQWGGPPPPSQGRRGWPTSAVLAVIVLPLLGLAVGFVLGSLGRRGAEARPVVDSGRLAEALAPPSELPSIPSIEVPSFEVPTVDVPTTSPPVLVPGELVAGDYTFTDVQHFCDYGYFSARARVVTQQPPADSAGFTMTFFAPGGSVVGTAAASLSELSPGQPATVEFNGSEACGEVERVEIQLDYEF